MALVHSRVRRIFYCLPHEHGALGSCLKLHGIASLNHRQAGRQPPPALPACPFHVRESDSWSGGRYLVFRGLLADECRQALAHELIHQSSKAAASQGPVSGTARLLLLVWRHGSC